MKIKIRFIEKRKKAKEQEKQKTQKQIEEKLKEEGIKTKIYEEKKQTKEYWEKKAKEEIEKVNKELKTAEKKYQEYKEKHKETKVEAQEEIKEDLGMPTAPTAASAGTPEAVPAKKAALTEQEEIEEKLKAIGLEPNFSLIKNSFVSIPSSNDDKMFEEFLKILNDFSADKNAFKFSRIDKEHRFPSMVLATCANQPEIVRIAKEKGVKPRYVFVAELFKNWNIGCTATESKTGNKSDQYKEIASSFVNFKSLMTYQEARHMQPEEAEGQPSEKLKRGIFGK